MRVLICGDRNWRYPELVKQELVRLQKEHGLNLFIITGGASGADTHAAVAAEELGIDQAIFPANWKGRTRMVGGRRVAYAGPHRNTVMLAAMQPQLVIAFHRFLPGSKGTKDMVRKAEKAGVPVIVIDASDEAAAQKAPRTRAVA